MILLTSSFASNPFVEAYVDSDLLGKLIFLSLIGLSIITWSVLIHKLWLTKKVKEVSLKFRRTFFEQKGREVPLDITEPQKNEIPNAFYIVYEGIKDKTQEILEKNQKL